MRKILLLAVFPALFLFSCKKEHSTQLKPEQKMYKVTLDMASGFKQTIQSLKTAKQQANSLQMDTATTNIAAYAPVIVLNIFNSSGRVIRQLTQKADSVTNFGVIVDSLATGTYTVIAAAGQKNLVMHDSDEAEGKYGVFYSPSNNVSGFIPVQPWQDTFIDNFSLTINNGPVNQTVPLTRADGKLEIDFNDVIPANASRLDIEVDKDNFVYLAPSGQLGHLDTVTYHLPIPAAAKGTNTYKVSEIVLNTTTPFTVIITGYDSSNNVIASHTVTNVTCTANQRTILTGNFAGGTQSNNGTQFTVNIDPNWGAPNIVHY